MEGSIPLRFRNLSSSLAVLVVAALTVLVGAIDLITGPELSLSLFYLLPVVLVAVRWGTAPGQVAAVGAAAAWFVIDLVSGGTYSHPLIPYWNAAVRFGFFSIGARLIDSLNRAVARETALARTDSLTGLPNRRAFGELAAHELARSARSRSRVAVAAIDLDDFKLVNDRRGHEAGDEILRRFALTARRVLRSVDIVARMGGDEFAVLLPDVDVATALKVMRRFRRALATSEAGAISCSVGLAYVTGGVVSDALRTADKALYEAKAAGKGSILLVDLVAASVEDAPALGPGPRKRIASDRPDESSASTESGGPYSRNDLNATGPSSPRGRAGHSIELVASGSGPSSEYGRTVGAVLLDAETKQSHPVLLIKDDGDVVFYDL